MMLPYIFVIVQLLFLFLIFFLMISFLTGAPYVPSPRKTSIIMVQLARITKGERIADLGSGDGRLLFLALKEGAQTAVGYEINPFLVLLTYVYSLMHGMLKHTRVYWKNFWSADLSSFDVLFLYLIPWRMEKLEKKLLNEGKPGARVVSNSFVFPNLPLIRANRKQHVFVFQIPEKKGTIKTI